MREFNIEHVVISTIKLPCDSVEAARDYLRKNPVDIMSQGTGHTFVTFEGGIDDGDIEMVDEAADAREEAELDRILKHGGKDGD